MHSVSRACVGTMATLVLGATATSGGKPNRSCEAGTPTWPAVPSQHSLHSMHVGTGRVKGTAGAGHAPVGDLGPVPISSGLRPIRSRLLPHEP